MAEAPPFAPVPLRETPSQTAGPFVHIGLAPAAAGLERPAGLVSSVVATGNAAGERIRLEGRVLDGTGTPARDAVVELWQANAAGRYRHPADTQDRAVDPAFRGFGRAACDFETGLWTFETVKPGPVAGRAGTTMAPHVNLYILARGINIGLHTRLYFADEDAANAADPVLALIEQPARRRTLIAARDGSGPLPVYHLDIRLQGEEETVFFDV